MNRGGVDRVDGWLLHGEGRVLMCMYGRSVGKGEVPLDYGAYAMG